MAWRYTNKLQNLPPLNLINLIDGLELPGKVEAKKKVIKTCNNLHVVLEAFSNYVGRVFVFKS